MDYVIDLDHAADEIARRRPGWELAGLSVEAVTWRDYAAPWPQTLERDRNLVTDPDSIGVEISGPGDARLFIVLFRGGWADVDAVTREWDAVIVNGPRIRLPRDFGLLLDQYVVRIFDVQSV